VVDRFEQIDAWSAHPADGVSLALRSDVGHTGRALRLDFAFPGGGYAIARRAVSLDLPADYVFTFWIRGIAPPNTLEFKLIDQGGENVWWYTERDRVFDGGWHQVTIRRRQIGFAWGPRGGGALDHAAAIELVITAGRGGGKGTVWFDDLILTPLPESGPYTLTPLVRASANRMGHAAALLLDGDTTTSWRAPGPHASVTIDFLRQREYGGLMLAWEPGRAAGRYSVLASDDGKAWRLLARRARGRGARDYFFLPDHESRFLRLDLAAAEGALGFGLREVRVEPLESAATRNAFFAVVARDAARGSFPRYLVGERANWTVVGVDRAMEEALLNEDGAIEPGTGSFSVEPFLLANGRLVSWNDVARTASLAQQRLPIPSVAWRAEGVELLITAFARGSESASSVVARYRISNHGRVPVRGSFFLALRPFQVNPPWQFLGTPGGVSRVDSMHWDGHRVLVNGDRLVVPLTPAGDFGATPFSAGDVVEYLRAGVVPPQRAARDAFGAASGALSWRLDLAPDSSVTIAVEIPLNVGAAALLADRSTAGVDQALHLAEVTWEAAVDRATIRLPDAGSRVANSIASTLGYILVNRDGSAIQPGSRSYERSWIRDGSLTSTALLRFGHADAVRDFLLWYARYQYPDGKIPCCVDRRGADPVAEHDSHGEFIYLVMEYFRHTGDLALLAQMWPHVAAAVGYLDSLRQTQRTATYRTGSNRLYFGLLPPSISHEGYSAKPMHSYWDDFFALRGFKDAAAMASVLGRTTEATRIGTMRDEFATDLFASIDAVIADHHIDYIPGSADLGDFDATSTTIALTPVEALPRLPKAALEHTFERYWTVASARRSPAAVWDAYTPYELRTVGAMLRLGWKDRALAMLDDFLADQAPVAWNQWPEVVWHDRSAPKFIGDLPHTWVGSDFLRSAADLFVYEREADSALVIARGIPEAWLGSPGVAVNQLSTWWGLLSYTAIRVGTVATISIAAGVRVPAGGLVVYPPGSAAAGRVSVNGETQTPAADGAVVVRILPATIVFER
jgi:hypothetical protein